MAYKILTGNFPNPANVVFSNTFGGYSLKEGKKDYKIEENLSAIERITEQNKTSFLGKAGRGFAGGLLFGPLGVAAGLLSGGSESGLVCAMEVWPKWKFVAVVAPEDYMNLRTIANKNAAAGKVLKDSDLVQLASVSMPSSAPAPAPKEKKKLGVSDLPKLKKLLDDGVITEEDYTDAKNVIMGYKPEKSTTQKSASGGFDDSLLAPEHQKPTLGWRLLKWTACILLFLALCSFLLPSPDKKNTKQGSTESTVETTKTEQSAPKQKPLKERLEESIGKAFQNLLKTAELPAGSHCIYSFSKLEDDDCGMNIRFDKLPSIIDFEDVAYVGLGAIVQGYEENNIKAKSIMARVHIYVGSKHIGVLYYPSTEGAAADWKWVK